MACAPAVEKRNVPGITANKIIVDTMGVYNAGTGDAGGKSWPLSEGE